jgi:hypothetical protein
MWPLIKRWNLISNSESNSNWMLTDANSTNGSNVPIPNVLADHPQRVTCHVPLCPIRNNSNFTITAVVHLPLYAINFNCHKENDGERLSQTAGYGWGVRILSGAYAPFRPREQAFMATSNLQLKPHLFDLLWTCCITNPQQVHNNWSLGFG